MPAQFEAPTLLLALDSAQQSLQRLAQAGNAALSPRLPQIQMLADQVAMTRAYAQSLWTGHLPKVQASAKASQDYPNGPVLETVQQNTFSVNGSLSLYEFGRISNQVSEQESLAASGELQQQQSLANLQISWQKSRDQIEEFKTEGLLDQQAVKETADLARLVYDAYRAGRSSYLEVQSADYRALGAKIQAVRTQVQTLMQLALLDSLSENEVK